MMILTICNKSLLKCSLLLLLAAVLTIVAVHASTASSASVKIRNHATGPIEIMWIDEKNDHRMVSMGAPIADGKEVNLASFRGHLFMIRAAAGTDLETAAAAAVYFRKSPLQEAVSIYYDGFNKKLLLLDDPIIPVAANAEVAAAGNSIASAVTAVAEGPHPSNAATNKPDSSKFIKHSSSMPHSSMQAAVSSAAQNCQHLHISSSSVDVEDGKDNDVFIACMAEGIMQDVLQLAESKSTVQKYRNLITSRLRNYTCADEFMPTTAPLYSYPLQLQLQPHQQSQPQQQQQQQQKSYDQMTSNNNNNDNSNVTYEYTANVLLDQDAAKIWLVRNFISDDECDIIESFGRPRLQRATVAAADGSSVVSDARKANQASYQLHNRRHAAVSATTTDGTTSTAKATTTSTSTTTTSTSGGSSDPLWGLFNRAMEMINTHAGYSLQSDGQEDFTIIQYDPNDHYSPHCDGQCDGLPHISKGRVATAVLYCKPAQRGGATAFTKADVFVNPQRGDATFFAYKGTDGRMDNGLTEHSGCPVLAGEKFISAIWFREGVTSQDPWSSYDPCGVPILL